MPRKSNLLSPLIIIVVLIKLMSLYDIHDWPSLELKLKKIVFEHIHFSLILKQIITFNCLIY